MVPGRMIRACSKDEQDALRATTRTSNCLGERSRMQRVRAPSTHRNFGLSAMDERCGISINTSDEGNVIPCPTPRQNTKIKILVCHDLYSLPEFP